MKNLPAHLKHRVIPQFERAVSIEPVEVVIPMPPSVNAAYKNVIGKGRARTDRYHSWANIAGQELNKQKPKRMKGRVEVWIYLEDSDNRRSDCDNRSKAVLDLLVDHRVIEDDDKRFVRSCHQVWSETQKGCRVSIRPAPVHSSVPA
jgi:Holliday junction resolvase RusA-like endonuclease